MRYRLPPRRGSRASTGRRYPPVIRIIVTPIMGPVFRASCTEPARSFRASRSGPRERWRRRVRKGGGHHVRRSRQPLRGILPMGCPRRSACEGGVRRPGCGAGPGRNRWSVRLNDQGRVAARTDSPPARLGVGAPAPVALGQYVLCVSAPGRGISAKARLALRRPRKPEGRPFAQGCFTASAAADPATLDAACARPVAQRACRCPRRR